jgi:hypothetical protein
MLLNIFYLQDGIDDKEMDIILEKLHHGVTVKLPSYARPIFVRLATELDLTGDFFNYMFGNLTPHKVNITKP